MAFKSTNEIDYSPTQWLILNEEWFFDEDEKKLFLSNFHGLEEILENIWYRVWGVFMVFLFNEVLQNIEQLIIQLGSKQS